MTNQYTCERHADEVKKGGACCWCEIERLRGLQTGAVARAYAREADALLKAFFPSGSAAGVHISAHGHAVSELHKFLSGIAQLRGETEPTAEPRKEVWCGVCKTRMKEIRPGVWEHDGDCPGWADPAGLSENRGVTHE